MLLVYLLRGVTSRGELVWDANFAHRTPRAMRHGATLYEGVPYSLARDAGAHGGIYVIVSRQFAAEETNQKSAWNLYRSLLALRRDSENPAWFLEALLALLKKQPRMDPARDDMWSLMLVQFAREMKPQEYLAGQATLGDAFLDSILGVGPPAATQDRETVWTRRLVLQRIFGDVSEVEVPGGPVPRPAATGLGTAPAVVNLVPSPQLVSALVARELQRRAALEGAQALLEAEIKAMLLIVGMLPNVTHIWLLDMIFSALIGYLDFALTLRKLERQGPQETDKPEVYGSIAGIALPTVFAVAEEFKYSRPVAGIAGLAGLFLLAINVLSFLVEAIEAIIAAAQHFLEALEAGFNHYEECDPDQSIFIPAE